MTIFSSHYYCVPWAPNTLCQIKHSELEDAFTGSGSLWHQNSTLARNQSKKAQSMRISPSKQTVSITLFTLGMSPSFKQGKCGKSPSQTLLVILALLQFRESHPNQRPSHLFKWECTSGNTSNVPFGGCEDLVFS